MPPPGAASARNGRQAPVRRVHSRASPKPEEATHAQARHARHSVSSPSSSPPARSTGGSASPGSARTHRPARPVAASAAASAAVQRALGPPRGGARAPRTRLATVTAGKLTVGTDNPAYPPYFAENAGGQAHRAVGARRPDQRPGLRERRRVRRSPSELGFAKDEVAWVVVPFANSYAPGAKTFDIDLNQVTVQAERTQTADLSEGLLLRQPVARRPQGQPAGEGHDVAELKDYLFGAQVGTTSYDAIDDGHRPDQEAAVYDTNDAAIEALNRARSTASSSTCRPPTTSPTSRSTMVRHDRRPVPGRHARVLQRRPGQGQPADRLREQRHRRR